MVNMLNFCFQYLKAKIQDFKIRTFYFTCLRNKWMKLSAQGKLRKVTTKQRNITNFDSPP
jgi:fructose 1,6-bisphosphatase